MTSIIFNDASAQGLPLRLGWPSRAEEAGRWCRTESELSAFSGTEGCYATDARAMERHSECASRGGAPRATVRQCPRENLAAKVPPFSQVVETWRRQHFKSAVARRAGVSKSPFSQMSAASNPLAASLALARARRGTTSSSHASNPASRGRAARLPQQFVQRGQPISRLRSGARQAGRSGAVNVMAVASPRDDLYLGVEGVYVDRSKTTWDVLGLGQAMVRGASGGRRGPLTCPAGPGRGRAAPV